ncbi:MAG: DUF1553 domain-containing protein [Planctomycetaceae bacterium]|nr:DUF1553 domain-containing protein [Planctomycetaceae bacterium]
MKMPRIHSLLRSIVAFALTPAALSLTVLCSIQGSASADDPGPVDFERDIAPIFSAHCVRCHSSENAKGNLSLTSFRDLQKQDYVIPGDPDSSYLIDLVTSSGGDAPEMPSTGEPLSPTQVNLLRRWIASGADWPVGFVIEDHSRADGSWWSLQALSDVKVPEGVHPIDYLLQSVRDAHQLPEAPAADRLTLIRRLTFDLTGLPPTPEEIDCFAEDASPDAYSQLVDRLLASPHFGERWARHWLDIAHYADTHGFERDQRRDHAWPYRDYVIRAFNSDKPYDQFLKEQIAGDIIAPEDADTVVATGFLAAGPWDFVGQVETKSPELRRAARALDLDDMVTQVMAATIGMTVNCARCHDHKLDPISQQDYYRLTAVFSGLRRGDRDVSQQQRQHYDSHKKALQDRIEAARLEKGRLQQNRISLADIVGGGNGYGTGTKGHGLDPRTGVVQERSFGDLGNVVPGHFAATKSAWIDGVFVPAEGETIISSTGLKATDLPANSGKAWDMIRHGPVASQFSTVLGAIDYNTPDHALLGLHANAGITFDLHALRSKNAAENHSAVKAFCLTAVAGYGGKTEQPSAEFRVLVDGVLQASGRLGRHDAVELKVDLSPNARFLTFIATDGGNGYSHDQICFGDPYLIPVHDVDPAQEAVVQQRSRELDRQIDSLEQELRALGAPPTFYGVMAEQPPATHVLLRGDPEQPAEEVSPGTLGWETNVVVFGDSTMSDADRRTALAEWILNEARPLTARVIVNRLWHWHFGQGIVTTPSDFGRGGQQPTHPKLLDWLAAELIRSGWSLKHIHRLIMTSQAYQMVSHLPSASETAFVHAQNTDSDNRFLWRMNARRLEAEAVRDAVLAVTGRLNPAMYGPGYRDFDYEEAYAPIYRYRTADSPDVWRRSIYRFTVRTTPQQFLTTLDCPDPANLTPVRNVTTTPLQSLAMFNNDFILKQAGYFAERLAREESSEAKQVDRAFRLAFGRFPTSVEASASARLVAERGLTHLCRVLFNASEFVYID